MTSTPNAKTRAQSNGDWPNSIPPLTVRVISASSDIALLIDQGGVIEHASASDPGILASCESWVGLPFVEVVSEDSIAKAQTLVDTAGPGPDGTSREINHPISTGTSFPVRYTAVATDVGGALILIGRDLRPAALLQQRFLEAQQATEREFALLRMAETRYRIMFQFASEPILVTDATSLRVVEANAAAIEYFALVADSIGSTTLPALFASESSVQLQAMARSARLSGRMETVEVNGRNGETSVQVTARSFRQHGSSYLMVRARSNGLEAPNATIETPVRQVHGMVEHAPDGCVIVDPQRNVLHANIAFLELAQLASKQQVIGQSLDRWLGRPGIDLSLIEQTLADHRVIRNFPTIIRGEFGGVEEVELSAVTAWSGDSGTTGFIIRSRKPELPDQPGARLPHSVQQLAQLVGRVPLKDLVRETSDVIEKLCIEAALDLSKGNRASAAQVLGLSRQSFYGKLHRFRLGGLTQDVLDQEFDS